MEFLDISIRQLGGHEMAESAQELLALITSIEGASSLWSPNYLQKLAKSEAHMTLAARTPNEVLAGVAIVHAVDAINPLLLNEPHMFLRRLVIAPAMRHAGLGGIC